ncbi:MAG: response regulator [Deltaproteobacteria bacterium]|nr:response regulator [Deltaproteobacteria bacterium]
MAERKESVEVLCSECNTAFRLWLPQAFVPVDSTGVRINCVKCGARYLITKEGKSFKAKKAEGAAAAPAKKQAAAAAPSTAEEAAPPAAFTETILMIEDDKVARAMAENQLRDAGIKTLAAKNSTEALHLLKKNTVDLIVTDLHLKNANDPESQLDGEELLKRIVDSGVNVPAIITTGKDVLDDLILDPKWFELHVKGFIQKGNPFWVEELKMKIKEVLFKE